MYRAGTPLAADRSYRKIHLVEPELMRGDESGIEASGLTVFLRWFEDAPIVLCNLRRVFPVE